MKFSLKALLAAALLAASSLSANAAQWNVSWEAMLERTTWNGVNYVTDAIANWQMSGVVEGTLQGDNNTVLVSDVISWTIDADTFVSSDFATGGVGSLAGYMMSSSYDQAAVFTLDGSNIDFLASNAASDSYIQFIAGFALDFIYYGAGNSHAYAGSYPLSTPLTNWSMTPVSAPVPEPSAALLLLAGLPLLARRRKA